MLDKMRNGAQHPIVKGLFFILAAMFVVWGVGDVFNNSGGSAYVAKVGKSKVTPEELDNVVRAETDRYQQMTGKTLTSEEIEMSGVKNYALGQLIRERITSLRAEDLKIKGGNKDVAANIQENKVFFDDSGKFDKARFKELLRANGFTEERFVNGIKKEAAVRNLMDSLTASSVGVDVIAKSVFSYRNEKRTADIITISSSIIKDVAEPSDTDLVQYYKDNQGEFEVPEQRAVSYVSFNIDKVKGATKLGDEELKTAYDANIQQFKSDESRDVTQYLFNSEAEAASAYEKISKGEVKDFATNKMDMGSVTGDSVPDQVKSVIFALKEKEASKPTKSDLGWHVFVLNSIQAAKTKSFEEVKKDIEKELLEKKLSDEFARFGHQVEDEFAAGKKMEDIAKEFDLVIKKVPVVDSKGNNGNGAKSELPDEAVTLPLVFGLESGVASNLTLLSDNATYVIFRVDSVNPKRVKALDEVKAIAVKSWKNAQKVKLLQEKSTEIAKKLRDGADYKSLASELNLKIESSRIFTRYSDSDDVTKAISTELKRELFNLKTPGAYTGAYPANDGFAIAKLEKVITTKASENKEDYKTIKSQLEDEMRDDIMAQYTVFLREEYPISIKAEKATEEK